MKTRYMIITIVLIFIIGIIVLINFFTPKDTIIKSGNETSEDTIRGGESTAPVYLSNIEATVLSIELDGLENEDCGVLFENSTICPRDKAIIRIDNFENIDAPGLRLLEVGSEVTVYFKYSARPAKLMKDRKQVCGGLDEDECPPAYVTYVPGEGCRIPDGTIIDCDSIYLEDKPTEIIGNFIIYHFSENYHKFENEVILPGIQEGNKIKFTSSVIREDFVDIYGANSQIYDIEVYDLISQR